MSKSIGHGNMEESKKLFFDCELRVENCFQCFPDASRAYCSQMFLPLPFGLHNIYFIGNNGRNFMLT